jgi:hypothetical protein
MVQALDAGHAQEIVRAQHASGRLSTVLAELLDPQDRHKLLAAMGSALGICNHLWHRHGLTCARCLNDRFSKAQAFDCLVQVRDSRGDSPYVQRW